MEEAGTCSRSVWRRVRVPLPPQDHTVLLPEDPLRRAPHQHFALDQLAAQASLEE